MAIKFTNNASSTLASSISASAVTITLASAGGSLFPALSGGDYFYATLVDSSSNMEIVKVTARSGDVLTVVRGQDGTTGQPFIGGDKFELRPTAAALTDIAFIGYDHIADTVGAHAATAISNTPAGTISATTVQGAIDDLATEKVAKSGDTMSGTLTVSVSGANNAIVGTTGGAANFGGVFTNTDGGITISFKAAGSNAGDRLFSGTKGASEVVYCDEDGNFVAAGNVTSNSDERLKKNWREVPAEFVEQLASVKSGVYDRVDEEMTQVGVSAQSLAAIMPNAVYEGNDGTLSVAYGNAALVACVELAKRVVELEKQLAELKG